MVAAIQRLPFAPAAAAHDGCTGGSRYVFSDEIGLIPEELTIDAERRFQRAFNLRRCMVLRLQSANRNVDEREQGRHIFGCGFSNLEIWVALVFRHGVY